MPLHPSRINFDLLTLEVLLLPFELVYGFYRLGPVSGMLRTVTDIEMVCQVSNLIVGTHIYTVASLANYICNVY